MSILTRLMKAAAPLAVLLGIGGEAGAQSPTGPSPRQMKPETLTQGYVDAALEGAKKACSDPLPEDEIEKCSKGIFKAQTEFYIHSRNTAVQHLFDLPVGQRSINAPKIDIAMKQLDLNCGPKSPNTQSVVEASKKDMSDPKNRGKLALDTRIYQGSCTAALKDEAFKLREYNLPIQSNVSHYGDLTHLADLLMPKIPNEELKSKIDKYITKTCPEVKTDMPVDKKKACIDAGVFASYSLAKEFSEHLKKPENQGASANSAIGYLKEYCMDPIEKLKGTSPTFGQYKDKAFEIVKGCEASMVAASRRINGNYAREARNRVSGHMNGVMGYGVTPLPAPSPQ